MAAELRAAGAREVAEIGSLPTRLAVSSLPTASASSPFSRRRGHAGTARVRPDRNVPGRGAAAVRQDHRAQGHRHVDAPVRPPRSRCSTSAAAGRSSRTMPTGREAPPPWRRRRSSRRSWPSSPRMSRCRCACSSSSRMCRSSRTPPAERDMKALFQAINRSDHLLVGDLDVTQATSGFGYIGDFKGGRKGIVLKPDAFDGDAVFKVPFPKVKRTDFPRRPRHLRAGRSPGDPAAAAGGGGTVSRERPDDRLWTQGRWGSAPPHRPCRGGAVRFHRRREGGSRWVRTSTSRSSSSHP